MAEIQTLVEQAGESKPKIETEQEDSLEVTEHSTPDGCNLMCRYCFLEESNNTPGNIEDLLLFNCDCDKNLGGVHFGCLRRWFEEKVVSHPIKNVTNYQWQNLVCGTCQKSLDKNYKYKGIVYPIIQVQKPKGPYLIFETITKSEKWQDLSSGHLLVELVGTEPIRFGRDFNSEIRESEISVDKFHAKIELQNGNFLLFDEQSKFGTLVKLRKDMIIEEKCKAIQVGGNVFSFIVKKPRQPSMLTEAGDHSIPQTETRLLEGDFEKSFEI